MASKPFFSIESVPGTEGLSYIIALVLDIAEGFTYRAKPSLSVIHT